MSNELTSFLIVLVVTADPVTFRAGNYTTTLQSAVQEEIESNLQSCGATAEVRSIQQISDRRLHDP